MNPSISSLETFTFSGRTHIPGISMFKLGTYFLCTLLARILWNGSLASDQHSAYVCLLDDPNPNSSDSFCLTGLRPLLNKIDLRLDLGNTRDAAIVNELLRKVDSLVDQHAKMEALLQGVQTKMEAQLREVQTKMEAQLQEGQAKMEAIQTRLERQLQALLTKMEAKPAAAIVSDSVSNKVTPNFERIGSRYLRIVEEAQDWRSAVRTCRQMKANLASITNDDEFTEIRTKLKKGVKYWLGSDFNRAPNLLKNTSCPILTLDYRTTVCCDSKAFFICQSEVPS